MKTINEQIIAKQDEMIKHLLDNATFNVMGQIKRNKLKSELSALKQQAEAEVSDKDYYNKPPYYYWGHNGVKMCYRKQSKCNVDDTVDGSTCNICEFGAKAHRDNLIKKG